MSTTTTRRAFLRQALASAGTLGFASFSGGILPASAFGLDAPLMAKSFPDYKALVCVFLYGGNDAFNMLAPSSPAEYAVYQAARQNLAVARDSLLPIAPRTPIEGSLGLHPAFASLKPRFESGQLAFLANVGPLIQPTTKEQYLAKSVLLPPQLFSHNDQQSQWQTLRGVSNLRTGWAGRIADELQLSGLLSMNTSIAGNNAFQVGAGGMPYVMSSSGAATYTGLKATGGKREQSRRTAFLRLLDGNAGLFERAYAEVQQRSYALADGINQSLAGAPPLATAFPANNRLGDQLRMVARMLSIREDFGLSRQVFFVTLGGFDSHDDQNQNQPGLYQQLAEALAAFLSATEELGISQSVTAFTASDFGRTLTSNGDGTDHGWGSHHLLLGGAVAGGDVYGRLPSLALEGTDDVGGGRILPTTAVDQYAATLARWFGLETEELARVFPNVANFATADLGFMSA
ncbi:MAG: DUF1501 domain-containing protein [Gammaproteobacteria bacterium]|nr:DUF1501 domain-containing protein [Gammaproteobacteria bacterium]